MDLSVNCSNIGFLFLQEDLVYFGTKGFFWPPPLLLFFFFFEMSVIWISNVETCVM